MMLGRQINWWKASKCDDYKINMDKLLSRALIHDIEEAITGDFPRPLKYWHASIAETLKKIGSQAMLSLVSTPMLDDIVDRQHWHREWRETKDASLEGRLLRFADFLSVVSFLHQEFRHGGRVRLEGFELSKYAALFDHTDYDFIRPWVVRAQEIINGEGEEETYDAGGKRSHPPTLGGRCDGRNSD